MQTTDHGSVIGVAKSSEVKMDYFTISKHTMASRIICVMCVAKHSAPEVISAIIK